MRPATRVLIVDDSATARHALREALRTDSSIEVVGEAATGDQAGREVLRLRPDIVTMDVYLHRENGIDVAATLMRDMPLPILVVTGRDPGDPKLLYDALAAGALDVFCKLPIRTAPTYDVQRRRLIRLLLALSRVPVVRRRRAMVARQVPPAPITRPMNDTSRRPEVILLGASTGGPPVVAELLRSLPSPCALPIVLVQHLAEGFDTGFATWLKEVTGHSIEIVRAPTFARSGRVYLAPSGHHLVFSSRGALALSEKSSHMSLTGLVPSRTRCRA